MIFIPHISCIKFRTPDPVRLQVENIISGIPDHIVRTHARIDQVIATTTVNQITTATPPDQIIAGPTVSRLDFNATANQISPTKLSARAVRLIAPAIGSPIEWSRPKIKNAVFTCA